MDRASDSGSEGWGFESLPVYQSNIIRTISSLWEMGSDYLFISQRPHTNDKSRRIFGGFLFRLFCLPFGKALLSFFTLE